MCKHRLAVVACAMAAGLSAAAAEAQNCHSTVSQSFQHTYQQNSMWPTQYVNAPRRAICDTFAAMTNNGWRQHNMLGRYHFENDGAELSEAGKVKMQWIATQAMPHRRNVFVQQGASADATVQRLAAVQQFVANGYPMAGEQINVNETRRQLEGHSAASVDTVFTGFHTNQPPPVLPESTGDSGSGGE